LNEEIKKSPENISLQYELASLYLNQAEYQLAKQHYQYVLEKKPNNVFVLNNLAYIHAIEKNPIQAMVYAQKAYQLAPDEPVISDTFGYLLINQGKIKDGLPLLEMASKNAPR